LAPDFIHVPSSAENVQSAPNLVITEILYDPTDVEDSRGEWIELAHIGSQRVDLRGLRFTDDKAQHTVDAPEPLWVEPGERVVFVRGSLPPSIAVAALGSFGELSLDNTRDRVAIWWGSELLDEVVYDELGGFPTAKGASLVFDTAMPAHPTANDSPANWCVSRHPFAETDAGTPGTAGPSCAELQGNQVAQEATVAGGTTAAEDTPKPPPTEAGGGRDEQPQAENEQERRVAAPISGGTETRRPADESAPDAATRSERQDEEEEEVAPTPPSSPRKPTSAPQLLITEIMADPSQVSDSSGEWIEVFNAGPKPADLRGVEVRDSVWGAVVQSDSPLWVAPGGFAVLAKKLSPSENGGVSALAVLPINLNNGEDSVVLLFGGEELDRVDYSAAELGTLPPGRAMQRSGDAPNTPFLGLKSWCTASVPHGKSEYGTPGSANSPCPVPEEPGCADFCGDAHPSGCHCDSACWGVGDCCPDVCDGCGFCADQVGLCLGLCGEVGSNGACWCDATCQEFGDCCEDACNTCGVCT
jgi:hypothetical protein